MAVATLGVLGRGCGVAGGSPVVLVGLGAVLGDADRSRRAHRGGTRTCGEEYQGDGRAHVQASCMPLAMSLRRGTGPPA
jgi:hypothetical protein